MGDASQRTVGVGGHARAELAKDGEDRILTLPRQLDELTRRQLHDLVVAARRRLSEQHGLLGARLQCDLLVSERIRERVGEGGASRVLANLGLRLLGQGG